MDSTALRSLPAARIVAAIADAAERWTDADFPPRVRATAAVEARLGYTTPTVEYALDRLFGGITRDALGAAIAGELGSLDALDGPVVRPGRPAAFARGVERVTIVSSDTTIGVAIAPLVFALCAKCAVVVKDRSDALVAAFVATLAEERPEIAAAVDVRTWTGGDPGADADAVGDADTVVAFGGTAALAALRARTRSDATFVPFGHRASAGYIGRSALAGDLDALAAAAARDALLYDGDGCLSLHVLFVERTNDETLARFTRALTGACAATMLEFPPGTRDRARQARGDAFAHAAAFRAANGGGAAVRAPDGAWAIAIDPPPGDALPFGGGAIPVIVVDALADAAAYVRAAAIPLQAVGVAGAGVPPEALAVALGAVRVTPLGGMQDPPLAGHHGGRARIADFVRWIDCE